MSPDRDLAAGRHFARDFCEHRCSRLSTISSQSSKPLGLTMEHVVYTQVYLEDISKYPER